MLRPFVFMSSTFMTWDSYNHGISQCTGSDLTIFFPYSLAFTRLLYSHVVNCANRLSSCWVLYTKARTCMADVQDNSPSCMFEKD